MTSDLDFYAHVATRGEVLGAGIGAQPAQWEAALGTDYLDIEEADLLRRDYGLVELSFQKDDDAWPCRGVSLQVRVCPWTPTPRYRRPCATSTASSLPRSGSSS
ncbi:hypothetical protein NQP46_29860 [Streptomyces albus]|nr:hypothetical protein NQP46_29860 [Streptomyces albus]